MWNEVADPENQQRLDPILCYQWSSMHSLDSAILTVPKNSL
jgi:hypothetical protein